MSGMLEMARILWHVQERFTEWHGKNGTDIAAKGGRNITSYEMARSDDTYVYVTHVLARDTCWLVSWRAKDQ